MPPGRWPCPDATLRCSRTNGKVFPELPSSWALAICLARGQLATSLSAPLSFVLTTNPSCPDPRFGHSPAPQLPQASFCPLPGLCPPFSRPAPPGSLPAGGRGRSAPSRRRGGRRTRTGPGRAGRHAQAPGAQACARCPSRRLHDNPDRDFSPPAPGGAGGPAYVQSWLKEKQLSAASVPPGAPSAPSASIGGSTREAAAPIGRQPPQQPAGAGPAGRSPARHRPSPPGPAPPGLGRAASSRPGPARPRPFPAHPGDPTPARAHPGPAPGPPGPASAPSGPTSAPAWQGRLIPARPARPRPVPPGPAPALRPDQLTQPPRGRGPTAGLHW